MNRVVAISGNSLSIYKVTVTAIIAFYTSGMFFVDHYASSAVNLVALFSMLILFKGHGIRRNVDKKWVIFIGMYFLAVLLSLSNTYDLHYGIKKLSKVMMFLVGPVILVPVFRWAKMDLKASVVWGTVAASLPVAAMAWYQVFVKNLWRAKGTDIAITFGLETMIFVLVLIAAIVSGVFVGKKVVALSFSLVLLSFANTLSVIRGSWAALFAALGLLVFLCFLKSGLPGRFRRVLVIALLVALPFGAHWEAVMNRFVTTSVNIQKFEKGNAIPEAEKLKAMNQNTSIGQRFLMWQVALDIWEEHPLVGSGVADFRHDLRQKMESGETNLLTEYGHAHSIYFHALATTGIAGLATMVMALVVYPFFIFARAVMKARGSDFHSLAGLLLVTGFAVMGLTESWFVKSIFVSCYVLLLSIFWAGSPAVGDDQAGLQ